MSKEIKQGNKRDVLTKLPKLMIPFIAILLIIVGFSVLHAYKYLNSRYFKSQSAKTPVVQKVTSFSPSSSLAASNRPEFKPEANDSQAQGVGRVVDKKEQQISPPTVSKGSSLTGEVKEMVSSPPVDTGVSVEVGNIINLSIPPVLH